MNQRKCSHPLCNWCGETTALSCNGVELEEDFGLRGRVSGGYHSTPGNGDGALDDMTIYAFSLCEFCLDHLFQQFRIPPTVADVVINFDTMRADSGDRGDRRYDFRPAHQRIAEDDWRRDKESFFAEAQRRANKRLR